MPLRGLVAKKDKSRMQVIVHRYQIRRGTPTSPAVLKQLRLQNEMWNALVAMDRDNRARARALTDDDPDVIAADDALTALTAERDRLITERKRLRQQARKKIATPVIDFELFAIKSQIKEARQKVNDARKAARENRRGSIQVKALIQELKTRKAARQALLKRRNTDNPPSKDELAASRQRVKEIADQLDDEYEQEPNTLPAVENARKKAVVAIRQRFSELGLHWGNYNAVIDSYETARSQAIKKGIDLKFHAFTGEGRLTSQIQGGMTQADLLSCAKGQVSAQPEPNDITSRKRAPMMHDLVMRVDSEAGGSWAMLMSRPFPDDAKIKQVQLVRRRVASHYRESVVMTATGNVEIPKAVGDVVAVDLGWRRLTNGIRVATFVYEDGQVDHIICPERVISMLQHCDDIRSRRDEMRLAILARIARIQNDTGFYGFRNGPTELAALASGIRQTPPAAFGRIARLAWAWKEYPDWRSGDFDAINEWRRKDKRLWEEEANLRDHALAVRLDHYRKEATRVLNNVGTLVLEKFDIAKIALKETPSGDETEQVQAMRHYRMIAAPGLLRQWLIIQANKRGIEIPPGHEGESNNPHADCGTRHAVPDEKALRRYCPRCGSYYDVDENACRVMLKAYLEHDPEPDSSTVAA